MSETLKLMPYWSDRKTAEHVGVSERLVSEMRSLLLDSGAASCTSTDEKPSEKTLPIAKRLGRDGKTYR